MVHRYHNARRREQLCGCVHVQARIHDTVPDMQVECDISSYGVKQHNDDTRDMEDGFRKFIVAKDNFAPPHIDPEEMPGEECTG